MTRGCVTARREAVVSVRVVGGNAREEDFEAVIDTGFNGHPVIPIELVHRLALRAAGVRRGVLGDGSAITFTAFRAIVIWNGRRRRVVALAANGDALVGMSLLEGCRLTMDIVAEGAVTIEPLRQ